MSRSGLLIKALFVVELCGSLTVQLSAGSARRLVGQVEATNGVAVAGWPAQSHDAVFSGDVLTTSEAATALVRFSALSQSTVVQHSSVRFGLTGAGRPLGDVASGMVLTTTAGRKGVIITTAKYKVEPVEEKRTIYLVGLLPDQRTVIAARQGDVSITDVRSKKHFQLATGRYIVIEAGAVGLPGQQQEENKQAPGKPAGQATPPPAPPPKPAAKTQAQAQPQPPPKPVKQPWHIGSLSHGASIALILAAAGGAGGAVAAAAGGGGASASPSTP